MTRTDKRGATAHNSPSEEASNIDERIYSILEEHWPVHLFSGNGTKVDLAARQFSKLIKDIALEVIGADDKVTADRTYVEYWNNKLRTQQRAKLTKLLGDAE